MHGRKLAAGLILCFLAACHPKEGEGAPPLPAAGSSGSFSGASSKSYERDINLGRLEISRGVSKSHAVTQDNGGYKNGGSTSVARSTAVSREVSLAGGLDVGSTLTLTESRTNGAVSRGIAQEVNIGKLGIDTSLSRDNRKNGFGLHRQPDGDLSLNVGALNVDLSRNARPQSVAQTNADATADGKNARATSSSSSHTQQQNYGRVGVTKTRSQSTALGHTEQGRTQANTAGGTGRTATQAATSGGTRHRRGTADSSNGMNNALFKDSGTSSSRVGSTNKAHIGTRKADGNNAGRFEGFRWRAKLHHKRQLFHAGSSKFSSFLSLKNSYFGIFSQPKKPNKEATEISDLIGSGYNRTLSTSTDAIAKNEPQGRTFYRLISDFFGNLFRDCIRPCTIEAFQQNRCCETVLAAAPPTPLISPSILPRPLHLPVYRPPAVVVSPPLIRTPVYCCNVCSAYAFYGPPPCIRPQAGNAFFNFGRTLVGNFARTGYVTINAVSSYFG